MPINMGLAALLMSGAMNGGEPAATLTLGADAFSQNIGGAPLVLVQSGAPLRKPQSKKIKKAASSSATARAAAPAQAK